MMMNKGSMEDSSVSSDSNGDHVARSTVSIDEPGQKISVEGGHADQQGQKHQDEKDQEEGAKSGGLKTDPDEAKSYRKRWTEMYERLVAFREVSTCIRQGGTLISRLHDSNRFSMLCPTLYKETRTLQVSSNVCLL